MAFVPARIADAIEQVVDDELVIYDLTSDDVHLLNATSTAVWRAVDGERDAAAIGATSGLSEDVVTAALVELGRVGLLIVSPTAPRRVSRRQLMRHAAIAAVALPVVTSIAAPNAAAAGSGCLNSPCQVDADCGIGGACLQGCCFPASGCGIQGDNCFSDAECCNNSCTNGLCD